MVEKEQKALSAQREEERCDLPLSFDLPLPLVPESIGCVYMYPLTPTYSYMYPPFPLSTTYPPTCKPIHSPYIYHYHIAFPLPLLIYIASLCYTTPTDPISNIHKLPPHCLCLCLCRARQASQQAEQERESKRREYARKQKVLILLLTLALILSCNPTALCCPCCFPLSLPRIHY